MLTGPYADKKVANFRCFTHANFKGLNAVEFSGLSPKILFYKCVKSFKTFYDKIKPLIESKDSKYISAINL